MVRLDAMNDEVSCFGIMFQCHLTLMRNEKQVDWGKEVIECNELMDENEKKEKEMKQMAKMHDRLMAKYEKLMNDYDVVINVNVND